MTSPHRSPVIITGLPCTGKTSLAHAVGACMGVPVFSKDSFKELLADNIDRSELTTSKGLGIASEELLLHVSEQLVNVNSGHVIESVFRAEYLGPYLRSVATTSQPVVVLLSCPRDILIQRFAARSGRHKVHDDGTFLQKLAEEHEIDVEAFEQYTSSIVRLDTTTLSDAVVNEYAQRIAGHVK